MRSSSVQPAVGVAAGDGHDEAQVGLDELVLGLHVAALDALGERDLLFRREQRDLADLAQVHAHGVVAGRLDGEVQLGDALALGLLFRFAGACLGAVRVVHAVGADHVDPEVVEGDVDVVDLLRREVDVGQDFEDVLRGEVALLLALVEQDAYFLYGREDRLVRRTICC